MAKILTDFPMALEDDLFNTMLNTSHKTLKSLQFEDSVNFYQTTDYM